MFPLKWDDEKGCYVGADEEHNEFMDEVVKVGEEGDAMENAREAFEISWAGTRGFGSGEVTTPVEVHNIASAKDLETDVVRVRDLSRLWCYRNGKKPADLAPMFVGEDGVVRTATL